MAQPDMTRVTEVLLDEAFRLEDLARRESRLLEILGNEQMTAEQQRRLLRGVADTYLDRGVNHRAANVVLAEVYAAVPAQVKERIIRKVVSIVEQETNPKKQIELLEGAMQYAPDSNVFYDNLRRLAFEHHLPQYAHSGWQQYRSQGRGKGLQLLEDVMFHLDALSYGYQVVGSTLLEDEIDVSSLRAQASVDNDRAHECVRGLIDRRRNISLDRLSQYLQLAHSIGETIGFANPPGFTTDEDVIKYAEIALEIAALGGSVDLSVAVRTLYADNAKKKEYFPERYVLSFYGIGKRSISGYLKKLTERPLAVQIYMSLCGQDVPELDELSIIDKFKICSTESQRCLVSAPNSPWTQAYFKMLSDYTNKLTR